MNVVMILIILGILLLGCFYVSWHVWHIVPLPVWGKWCVVTILAAIVGLIFVNGSGITDKLPMRVSIAVYEVGWSSLFILLYAVMLFIVYDLLRLVRVLPSAFFHNSWTSTLLTLCILVCIFVYGYFHYMDKKAVYLDMPTKKEMKAEHKVLMVSDLHIGYHNRADEVRRWVDMINAEKPELVLIAGDVVDGSIRAVNDLGFIKELRRIKAPVYACLGNHEYYGGEAKAETFDQAAGITLLIDKAVKVPLLGGDSIVIIGRDDRTNKRRASIKTLMSAVSQGHYTILMDHQPYKLSEAEKQGVDFQLSGHTHYGQVWPIGWIEDAIYENAYGPLQKGNTQYYVSSGIGIWGGKFRIGSQSEYVVGKIKGLK